MLLGSSLPVALALVHCERPLRGGGDDGDCVVPCDSPGGHLSGSAHRSQCGGGDGGDCGVLCVAHVDPEAAAIHRPLCGGVDCAAGVPADRKAGRRCPGNSTSGTHVGHCHDSRIDEPQS